MFRYLIIFLLVVGCSSNRKVLKEIDKDAPHHGHLYKLDKYVIEVAEVPTHVLKFYFYTVDKSNHLVQAPITNIHLKNGLLDPKSTKQNFGIVFVERKTHIEGIIEKYELHEQDNHAIIVDVSIGDKKRTIYIPWESKE